MMDEFYFAPLNEEQFQSLEEEIKKSPFVSFYKGRSTGIFYQEKVIGIFSLSSFIDNSYAISLFIKEQYRGKRIAAYVTEKIVEVYGALHPEVKQFICNVSPQNTSSLRAAEKLGWHHTYEYRELLIEEGAEYFEIYAKENPYYQNKTIK